MSCRDEPQDPSSRRIHCGSVYVASIASILTFFSVNITYSIAFFSPHQTTSVSFIDANLYEDFEHLDLHGMYCSAEQYYKLEDNRFELVDGLLDLREVPTGIPSDEHREMQLAVLYDLLI